MTLDELKVEFPTIDDYPSETFDAAMPQGYRVGCAGAYLRSNAVTRRPCIKLKFTGGCLAEINRLE